MKKLLSILIAMISILMLINSVCATTEQITTDSIITSNETNYENVESTEKNMSLTTKEEKIEYYSKICESETEGKALYYLYEIQSYSIPVCFIGMFFASLNFFIIGNKKIEKREQGFGMLIMFGLGLIMFQVLPLLFAIIVAGR